MYDDIKDLTSKIVGYLGLKSKNPIYPSTTSMSFHCPFHIDKTPSLFVDFETGRYHCFSCNAGGFITNLFYQLTGESAYKVFNIVNDNFSNFSRSFELQPKIIYDTSVDLKKVNIVYNKNLLEDATANRTCIQYLNKRGIFLSTAKLFNFKYSENITINMSKFINRLIVPIYENGILISFEGRRLDDTTTPKVLYPKNCTVNTLFDIDNLNKNNTLYACEGLMDLCLLKQCGLTYNCTSIFGASLTKRQIELLKEFKKIVYIPDNDKAGDGTINILKESNLSNCYILKLPKLINNVSIKDLGDLPKAHVDVNNLINKKWLNYEKKI